MASGIKFEAQSLASRALAPLVSALLESLTSHNFHTPPDTASFPNQEVPFAILGLCSRWSLISLTKSYACFKLL